MPLDPNAPVGENISEFHTGPTYEATAKKFGKARADAQAVAVAMHVGAKKGKGAPAKKVGIKK